jgi:hypothetical protein
VSPEGAAQVQEFHRQLVTNSADELRQEIKQKTGVELRELTTEAKMSQGAGDSRHEREIGRRS